MCKGIFELVGLGSSSRLQVRAVSNVHRLQSILMEDMIPEGCQKLFVLYRASFTSLYLVLGRQSQSLGSNWHSRTVQSARSAGESAKVVPYRILTSESPGCLRRAGLKEVLVRAQVGVSMEYQLRRREGTWRDSTYLQFELVLSLCSMCDPKSKWWLVSTWSHL